MKRITKLLMLASAITLLFHSCDKDEEKFYCDTLENIAGTWKMDSRTITFTKKYEFIDSVFYDQYNESLDKVIKGQFELINGFIELSDLKFTYLSDISVVNSLLFLFPTFRYEIIDNKLYFEEVGIFHPIGHKGIELKGKWRSNRLIVVYDTEQSPSYLSGNQIIEYEFNEDVNNYVINYQNSYGVFNEYIVGSTIPYRFETPYVYIVESDYLLGELKDNILITYSDGERVFNRID